MEKTKEKTSLSRIILGVLSVLIWIRCCAEFINVFNDSKKHFNGIYNMYDYNGGMSPVPKFVFYGVVVLMVVTCIVGILAAICKRVDIDINAMLGCMIMIGVMLIMSFFVYELQNHFLDSARNVLMFTAMGAYVGNISKMLYLYFVINIVLIFFMSRGDKLSKKDLEEFEGLEKQ